MDSLEKLTEYFKKFPGIVPRQARRFSDLILRQSNEYVQTLTESIHKVRSDVRQCSKCMRYFQSKNSSNVCQFCEATNRDGSTLLIVEKDIDLETLEKSKAYTGYYFVIGGTAPLSDSVLPPYLHTQKLITRIKELPDLKEIIFGLSANPDGDHTVNLLQKVLVPHVEERVIRMSILGRGLSTGTEIEYSDSATITSALLGRK